MATNVIMPALGVAQQTGTLLKWLQAEGQPGSKGEPLMEVETDKATVEIEAPGSGVLANVTASPGDEVPVGNRIAVLLAPVFAVQVQKYLEILREKRNRRMWIFHSLMATRAAKVSAQHVQALNMIDIEFYGQKRFGIRLQSKSEKRIIDAWKTRSFNSRA